MANNTVNGVEVGLVKKPKVDEEEVLLCSKRKGKTSARILKIYKVQVPS